MLIGLIDVDGHNFPNIPLMKLSAYHKGQGDIVEWYNPLTKVEYDKVYMSKVFSFTSDFPYTIKAKQVVRGGSGYAISLIGGKEVYNLEADKPLPDEVEHIYPDYSLYPELTQDTAYGFLTRGCPRGCSFCHVAVKEGKRSCKVSKLEEFWRGQKNIVLCDPNILACRSWRSLIQSLIDSKAYIDLNQGLDIRLMTKEKAELIKQIKTKNIHFAWDRYEDKGKVVPKFQMFKEVTGWGYWKLTVYVLVNYDTTFEQDLERVYLLRDMGYNPYIMVYDKEHTSTKDKVRQLQRWVNNRRIFRSTEKFEEYTSTINKKEKDRKG